MNKAIRIDRIVAASALHRDHLEAIYQELLELHNEQHNEYARDVFGEIVFDGRDYVNGLESIIRHKMKKQD